MGGGGGRKRVCVNFVSFAGISTSVNNVLEEEGAKPEKSRPSQLFTLQPTQTYGIHSHSQLSLSLTKYTHFLGFNISYVAMVIQTETGRGVCVCVRACVCVCMRERERESGGGGGGGGKSLCVCVNFVSFAGISTSIKNMSLKRRVLKDAHHLCLF